MLLLENMGIKEDLVETEHIHRKVRKSSLDELGRTDWSLLREAVIRGREERALELMDYIRSGLKRTHDTYAAAMALSATYVADTFGEEEVPVWWKDLFQSSVEARTPTGLDALEEMEACVVRQRQHQGHATITEEEDRFVATCDPCGSGGKLRREGIGGVTKKAYPWSWGMKNIPYYCIRCAVMWEQLPIQLQGFPERINVLSEDVNTPCYNYFYKKPELIPDYFYERVGMKKPECFKKKAENQKTES